MTRKLIISGRSLQSACQANSVRTAQKSRRFALFLRVCTLVAIRLSGATKLSHAAETADFGGVVVARVARSLLKQFI